MTLNMADLEIAKIIAQTTFELARLDINYLKIEESKHPRLLLLVMKEFKNIIEEYICIHAFEEEEQE